MFSDQFYFGRRLGDLGIGSSLPFAQLSVDALASALGEALDPRVAARTRDISATIADDGAAVAARQIANGRR
jgi:UDP:flavonoid glycosyltransferase YjiC (YdhE family)